MVTYLLSRSPVIEAIVSKTICRGFDPHRDNICERGEVAKRTRLRIWISWVRIPPFVQLNMDIWLDTLSNQHRHAYMSVSMLGIL